MIWATLRMARCPQSPFELSSSFGTTDLDRWGLHRGEQNLDRVWETMVHFRNLLSALLFIDLNNLPLPFHSGRRQLSVL